MNAQPRIEKCTCPTCGGYIGEAANLEAVKEAVTRPTQRCILETLISRPGGYVLQSDLVSALLQARVVRGEKVLAHTIHVQISGLRRQIERYGWTITNAKSAPSEARYRLIPTVGGA